jgi:hypothetical protein
MPHSKFFRTKLLSASLCTEQLERSKVIPASGGEKTRAGGTAGGGVDASASGVADVCISGAGEGAGGKDEMGGGGATDDDMERLS